MSQCRLAVLIPSYNRPDIIAKTLPTWLAPGVDKIFVSAEASSNDKLEVYEKTLSRFGERVEYQLYDRRLGSVNARNKLLEKMLEAGCKYAIMVDDDYLLPNPRFPTLMMKRLEADKKVGAVGGRVIVLRRRSIDPDFFLNTKLADGLSKALGYVFLDIKHERYAEFIPPFFMIRREVVEKGVRYDKAFDTPTAFREESDLQQQIKALGYRLMLDPKIYVIHLAVEYGGNRPEMSMKERMFWKARNNTIFLLKWYREKAPWYILTSTIILTLYRPQYAQYVLKGIKEGIAYRKETVKFAIYIDEHAKD